MSAPVPPIDYNVLKDLAFQASKQTLTRASLEAAAAKMKVTVGQLMWSLKSATTELVNPTTGARATAETVAGWARQVYSTARTIEGMSALESAAAAAAETTAVATETAGAGSAVASGGRVLGFFGRIGSIGGWLSGGAATAAGIAATVILLAPLAWYAGGVIGDMAGDGPTAQYGAAVDRPRGEPPAAPTANSKSEERYAVWLLENVASGSVWVGQESSITGSLTCNWEGGGLCASSGGADIPTAYHQLSSADYFTYDAAHTDFCSAITGEPEYWPSAFGTKADIYGGNYWIDLVGPCE